MDFSKEHYHRPVAQSSSLRAVLSWLSGAALIFLFLKGLTCEILHSANDITFALRRLTRAYNCKYHDGTFHNGSVQYIYFVTDGKCDVADELRTIEGALGDHLKNQEERTLRKTKCIDLSYGLAWNGYLLVGPADDFDPSMYCGPKIPFQPYGSDGMQDWHHMSECQEETVPDKKEV